MWMQLQILVYEVIPPEKKYQDQQFLFSTVKPRYNEDLGTMKITLLYPVSHIRVKKTIYKELGPAKLPCYKRVLLYPTSL